MIIFRKISNENNTTNSRLSVFHEFFRPAAVILLSRASRRSQICHKAKYAKTSKFVATTYDSAIKLSSFRLAWRRRSNCKFEFEAWRPRQWPNSFFNKFTQILQYMYVHTYAKIFTVHVKNLSIRGLICVAISHQYLTNVQCCYRRIPHKSLLQWICCKCHAW